MGELTLLIDERELQAIINRLAIQIRGDYKGKTPIVLGVLSGSFMFLADLVRALDMDIEIDFLKASSYGKRLKPSEKVLIDEDLLSTEIKDRDVIIVEDIIDTGNTLHNLLKYIENLGASTVRTCALLKRESSAIEFDYVGKVIGSGFIVGYGLDYKGRFRNLPAIYVMNQTD